MNIENNMSNRIGVFGGTFDPIHLGHKALAEAAISEANLKKLIVMPAHVQPFKKNKDVTDAKHRLKMAELSFKDNPIVDVSSFEIDKGTISYTYDTLTALKEFYPYAEMYFVMGADSFLMLDTWYKGIELLENFPFIVSVRPGYKEEELDKRVEEYKLKYGTEIIRVALDMPDISATSIRKRIQNFQSAKDLITEDVERYIYEQGLYK